MPIFVGPDELLGGELKVGGTDVKEVYVGGALVWSNTPAGQALITTQGQTQWVCPAGVTSISVCAIGAGGRSFWFSGAGTASGGGGLGWKNNILVVPGNSYTVQVGAAGGNSQELRGSWFINKTTVAGLSAYNTNVGGGYVGDGGGNGGNGAGNDATNFYRNGGGGGGAGGYTGNGGTGGSVGNNGAAGSGGGSGGGGGNEPVGNGSGGGGGGTGINGVGSNGAGGLANAFGGLPGGKGSPDDSPAGSQFYGGGARGVYESAVSGTQGAVRIIWGAGRSYPSNAADV